MQQTPSLAEPAELQEREAGLLTQGAVAKSVGERADAKAKNPPTFLWQKLAGAADAGHLEPSPMQLNPSGDKPHKH